MSYCDIVGVIRFSVLTERNLSNWKMTKDRSLDDAADIIFSDERMAIRFSLFENITLKAFDAQIDSEEGFKLLILTSTMLPDLWLKRLFRLASARPYMQVVCVKPNESVARLARIASLKMCDKSDGPIATFRIDDDDAVSTSYITDIRRNAVPENLGKALSWENGVYLERSPRDGSFMVTEVTYPSIALGIAYISSRKEFRTVYDLGNHTKIHTVVPMVIESRPKAWMRSIHGFADSGGGKTSRSRGGQVMTVEETAAYMGQDYSFLDFRQLSIIL